MKISPNFIECIKCHIKQNDNEYIGLNKRVTLKCKTCRDKQKIIKDNNNKKKFEREQEYLKKIKTENRIENIIRVYT